MPEVSKDSSLLVATSYQALQRALTGRQDTLICNCTIAILFAGIYIESNLNTIIEEQNLKQDFHIFMGKKRHPGLFDKMVWFYNKFSAQKKEHKITNAVRKIFESRIYRKFPGLKNLITFRNNLAHGFINSDATSIDKTLQLREQAKSIVQDLFSIVEKEGIPFSRDTTYLDALDSMQ